MRVLSGKPDTHDAPRYCIRAATSADMKTHQQPRIWNITQSDILWEDDYLVAVNKPAGIPSQPTPDRTRDNCYDAVIRYLQQQRGNNAYAGLHHRLDVLTSGVIVLTKSPEANRGMAAQFQSHTIQKVYCAICISALQPVLQDNIAPADPFSGEPFEIRAPIGEVPDQKIQKFCIGGKHRKPADTEFVCEDHMRLRDGHLSVFSCKPHTGRTHQIRVHLSSIGLPIAGDPLYGMPLLRSLRSIDPQRMCLHAESIAFEHPISHEMLTITAPQPKGFREFVEKARRLSQTL